MITFDRRETRGASAARAVVAILVACLLGTSMGCKESGSTTAPPNNTTGSGEYLGAGTPGTPITDTQRFAAFDSVGEMFQALSAADISTSSRRLAAYLRTMTVFDAAGISADGSVWAHFTDDRNLVVANNRPLGEPPQDSPPTKLLDQARQTTELPHSRKARVLRGLGTHFYDNTPKIKQMLTGNGYSISGEDATVAGLEQVSGDGVVYFETHGGSGSVMRYANGKLDSIGTMFSLLTTTPVTNDNDIIYASYLRNKLLTYFIVDNDSDVAGKLETSNHYGITAQFVAEKMSFGPNSLVFMNACGSFDGDFWKACVAKNADEYVGWSSAIISEYAIRASRYLFSRLLGATEFADPETPLQRAFELGQVKTDMSGPNIAGTDLTKFPDPTYAGQNRGYTHLMFAPLNPSFTLLAPSIEHVEVDESVPTLTLYGFFGTKPPSEDDRKITIDGIPRTISQWNNLMIVCDIPKFGQGSAGDVIVTAYGHTSNTVQLTEWRGNVTFDQPSLGTLREFYSFDIHFRADVHAFRQKPHETPKAVLETDVGLMEDSQGQFSIKGNAGKTCPPANNCVISGNEIWTPSDISLPYFGNAIPANSGFFGTVPLNPQVNKVSLIILGGVGEGLHSSYVVTTVCSGTSESFEIDDTFGSNTVVPPLAYIPLDMDGAYVIKAGHLDVSQPPKGRIPNVCDNESVQVTYTITWTDFQPTHPPLAIAAR